MKKKTLPDIFASIILASVLGVLAFLYVFALMVSSAPIIAAFLALNIRSFVRQRVKLKWSFLILAMPLLLVSYTLIALRLPTWIAPHPVWLIDGSKLDNSGELAQCSELVPPIAGQQVQIIQQASDGIISQEQAYQIANRMILQVDWPKQRNEVSGGFSWYPTLFEATLVTTKFSDGQERLVWYIPVTTQIGHHFDSAVIAIGYVDAQTGVPLMLITDMYVRLQPVDFAKPNGCPPFAPNKGLEELIFEEYRIALLFMLYLWLVMLVNWIRG